MLGQPWRVENIRFVKIHPGEEVVVIVESGDAGIAQVGDVVKAGHFRGLQ